MAKKVEDVETENEKLLMENEELIVKNKESHEELE